MLSVILATKESEQVLVPTLAALVPGATAGIVSEVILADAGSRDGTATIADVAGCRYVATAAPVGARLAAAAGEARAPWLLFLQPGVVPDATWIDEVSRFVRGTELARRADARAAVFRPPQAAGGARSTTMEALRLLSAALIRRARPDQGLLIAKSFYGAVGGHRADDHAEADLLHRLGRSRLFMLRCGAVRVAE